MIEVDVKKFIDDNFDYPALMERPNNGTGVYFVIEKVGGSRNEHIDSAMITVQTFAPSLYQAASVCEALNEAMLNDFIVLPNISSIELNSSYNYTDTKSKDYRYQSLFEIYYYGGNDT